MGIYVANTGMVPLMSGLKIWGKSVKMEVCWNPMDSCMWINHVALFSDIPVPQYMSQIKEKQAEKARGDWNDLTPQQRQETEGNYKQLMMLAR